MVEATTRRGRARKENIDVTETTTVGETVTASVVNHDSSGDGNYIVSCPVGEPHAHAAECSCKDFKYSEGPCKHIYAAGDALAAASKDALAYDAVAALVADGFGESEVHALVDAPRPVVQDALEAAWAREE